MLVMWILDLYPVEKKLAAVHHLVVVDLIATSNHHMEGSELVSVEDVSPQRVRSRKLVRECQLPTRE